MNKGFAGGGRFLAVLFRTVSHTSARAKKGQEMDIG
jgi:hypothetical protein